MTNPDNETSEAKSSQVEKYIVYKSRYVVSSIYSLAAIQNILMWLIFSPLQTTLQTVYNENITIINLGTILISNISYIPANFVASYILDTFGLRVGIIAGSILTTIGLWFRCLCKEGFAYIFIGQCFAGVAQPFFYSTPQKISNVWFGAEQRTMATTTIAISLNIGNALGAFMPQFFVDIADGSDPSQKGKILNQLQNMMLWTAIAGSIVLALTVLFFKEKPPTPPSKAAVAKKHNYKDSMKALFRDRNSMLFLFSTAASAGAIVTYGSVIQQVVDPYHISGDQVGNIVFISIIVGFVGAGLAGAYVNKTKKYKASIIVICAASTVALVGNYFASKTGNVWIFGALFCLYTTLISPLMPLALETAVELSFPVAEATSGGIWFVFNQLLSTVESLAVDGIVQAHPNPKGVTLSFVVMATYQFVCLFLLFFVKEKLKRTKYEKGSLLGSKRSVSRKAVMSAIGGASLMIEEETDGVNDVEQ